MIKNKHNIEITNGNGTLTVEFDKDSAVITIHKEVIGVPYSMEIPVSKVDMEVLAKAILAEYENTSET